MIANEKPVMYLPNFSNEFQCETHMRKRIINGMITVLVLPAIPMDIYCHMTDDGIRNKGT